MKLLAFYLCLFAIVFHAIFASLSLEKEGTSLSTGEESGGSKPKKAVGKLVKKKKPQGAKKKPQGKKLLKKKKRGDKSSKRKEVVVKEDRPKLLIDILPKELVKLVINYLDDGTYPITVSTHNWSFQSKPGIAVDSARVYGMANAEGIKGLDHSLANVKEDERRLIEFGNPQWFNYWGFSSSHDGQCVFFGYKYKALTNRGEQVKYGSKWLTQINVPEGGRLKHATFDSENSYSSALSRDGQALCVNRYELNLITRVYRVEEEAGKDPVAFMKFEYNGEVRAVSGNGNHVVISKPRRLEIHDISKDASKLLCEIDVTSDIYRYALNEDGSEAAFYANGGLRIMEVDKVSGSAMDLSAVVPVKVSESLGQVSELVYSDGGKLHVLHSGGKVSLFDPSTKELVLLEAPQEKMIVDWAISPNADYIALVQYVGKGESGKYIYRTIVKRKCKDSDWKDLF